MSTNSGTSCSFVLNPTGATMGSPRAAGALIHNVSAFGPGVQIVVTALLAPPTVYGLQFQTYAVSGSTDSGGSFGPTAMTPAGGNLWTFVLNDANLAPVHQLMVQINPATASLTPGPVVMAAVGDCATTCAVLLRPDDGAPPSSGGAVWISQSDTGFMLTASATLPPPPAGDVGYRLDVVGSGGQGPILSVPLTPVSDQPLPLFAGAGSSPAFLQPSQNVVFHVVPFDGEGKLGLPVLEGYLVSCCG